MGKMASINFSQNDNKNAVQSISSILQYMDITRYHETDYFLFSVNDQRRNYIRKQLFTKAKNRNSSDSKIIKDQNYEKQMHTKFGNYRSAILNTQKNFGDTGREIERHFTEISNVFSNMFDYTTYNETNLVKLKSSFIDYETLIQKVLISPVSDDTFTTFYNAVIANSSTMNNIVSLRKIYSMHKGKTMSMITDEDIMSVILHRFKQCDIKLIKQFFIEYAEKNIPVNEARSLSNLLMILDDMDKLSDINIDELKIITDIYHRIDKRQKFSNIKTDDLKIIADNYRVEKQGKLLKIFDIEKDPRLKSVMDVCKSIEEDSPSNDKIIGFQKVLSNFVEFYNNYHSYFEYVSFENHTSFGLDYLYFARLFIQQFNYFLMIVTWSLTTRSSQFKNMMATDSFRKQIDRSDKTVFKQNKDYYATHLRIDGLRNSEFYDAVLNWDIEKFSARMEDNADFEGSNDNLCKILNIGKSIKDKLRSSCSILKKKYDMYRENYPSPDEETKLPQQLLFNSLVLYYKADNLNEMSRLINEKRSSFYDTLKKYIDSGNSEKIGTIINDEHERHRLREHIFKINFSDKYDANISGFLSALFNNGTNDIRELKFALNIYGNAEFNKKFVESTGDVKEEAIAISAEIEKKLRSKNDEYFSTSLSTTEQYFGGYVSNVDEKFLKDTYSRYNFKYTNDPFQNVPDIKSMVEIINIDENGVVDDEQIKNVIQFDEIVVTATGTEINFTEKDFDSAYQETMYKIIQHKDPNKDTTSGAYFVLDDNKLVFVDTGKGNYGRISFSYNNSVSPSYFCKAGVNNKLIYIDHFDFVGPIKQYKILIETTIERKKPTEINHAWKGARKFSKIYLKPYDNETGEVLASIPTTNTDLGGDLITLLNHSYDYKTRRRGTNYLVTYHRDDRPIAFDLKNVYDIQAKTYLGTSKPCYDVYTMNALLSCHNLSKVDISSRSLLTPEQPKSTHSQNYFMVVNVIKPTDLFYRQQKKYYSLAEKQDNYPYDALICAINMKTRDRYEGLYHAQYYGNKNHPVITRKNQEIRDPIWMIQFDESKLQSVEVHDAITVSSNNSNDSSDAYKTGAFIVYSSPFEYKLDILTAMSLDTDDVMKLLENDEISYLKYNASLTKDEKEKIMNHYSYPWILRKDNKLINSLYSTPNEKKYLKDAVDDLLNSAFSTIFSKMATSKSNEISNNEYKKFFDLHQCLDSPYKKFDFLYTKEDVKSDHDIVSNNQKISFTAFVSDDEHIFTFGDLSTIGRGIYNKFKITLTFRAKPLFTGSTRKIKLVLGDLPRHDTTFVTEKENYDLYFTRSEISESDKMMLNKKGDALKTIEKLASNGVIQINKENKKVEKEIDEKIYEYDLSESNTISVKIDILDSGLRKVYDNYLHALKEEGIDGLRSRALMNKGERSEYPTNPADITLRNYLCSALIRDDFDPSFLGDSSLEILVNNYRNTSNTKISPINYSMEFDMNKSNLIITNNQLNLNISNLGYVFNFVRKHKSYVKVSYEKIIRSRKENSIDLIDSIFVEKLQKIMPETYSNMIWTLDKFFSTDVINEKLGDYLDSVRNSIVNDPTLDMKRAEIFELFNRFKIKTSSSDLLRNTIDMSEIDKCVYTIYRKKINF